MARGGTDKSDRPGIQSVEIASRILAAMTHAARPMPLKDVARLSGMTAAKVHRYLVSLTRTSLVAQDGGNGHYSIGAAAIALGLAGMYSVDVVKVGSEVLVQLRDATNETAVLAVWSADGPVVIRLEESSRPVFMNVRVGSTLPVLRSAVGRIFAAYLPAADPSALIAREQRSRPGKGAGKPLIRNLIEEIRRQGIAIVDGDLVPGVTALAAPVFDHRARIVASIALLGGPDHLEARADSRPAQSLKRAAATISTRLGYRGGNSDAASTATTGSTRDHRNPRDRRSSG